MKAAGQVCCQLADLKVFKFAATEGICEAEDETGALIGRHVLGMACGL